MLFPGLHVLGIFRVGGSKKRMKQVCTHIFLSIWLFVLTTHWCRKLDTCMFLKQSTFSINCWGSVSP